MCHNVVTGVCDVVSQCSDRSVMLCLSVVTGLCGVSQCSDRKLTACFGVLSLFAAVERCTQTLKCAVKAMWLKRLFLCKGDVLCKCLSV